MGEKKKEDLCRNFSRKDIQGLCKKYGLPANKSNFEMATSLILYLEKKNLISTNMWEATRSDLYPSGTSELQVQAGMASTRDQRNDCRGIASHSGSGNNEQNNQDVPQSDLQTCKAIVTSDKISENIGVLTQLHGDNSSGARLLENTFSSVVSSPVAAHSSDFQFNVSSDDGIQLCVDLNSTLPDWIESMKSRVHICQCHDIHRNSAECFQELGRFCSTPMKNSSALDLDKNMNNGNFEDRPSITTIGTGVQALPSGTDVGEGSSYSPRVKSCKDPLHYQENIGEKQATLSTRMEGDILKEVGGAKSDREEDKTVPESAVNILPRIESCNLSTKSLDPKHSGMPENQVLFATNDIVQKSSLRQCNGSLNTSLMYMPPTPVSLEMQAPPCTTWSQDVTPSPSRVGTSRSTYMHDEIQYTEREDRALSKSLQFHEHWHQSHMETADANGRASCSTEPGSMEAEPGRATTSRKCNGQVIEAQTHLITCHKETLSLSPYMRCVSQGIDHRTNKIETENGGFLHLHGSGQEANDVSSFAVGFHGENALLYPCSNVRPLNLIVPEQNGVNHSILANPYEHAEENYKNQPGTSVGNLDTNNFGDRRLSSECQDKDLMNRIGMNPVNFEFAGELKRKRQFNSVEEQSSCVNSDSRILRTSKQSAGDVHASRRRSSRLFTK